MFVTERDKHPQHASALEIEVVIEAFKDFFEVLNFEKIPRNDCNKRTVVKNKIIVQQIVT